MLEDVTARSLVLVRGRLLTWAGRLRACPCALPPSRAAASCLAPSNERVAASSPSCQVDELGKGTEVRAGASLAGALMEALDASGARGVFATHLHALLDLDLE